MYIFLEKKYILRGKINYFWEIYFLWKFWKEGGFGRKGDLVGRKEDLGLMQLEDNLKTKKS